MYLHLTNHKDNNNIEYFSETADIKMKKVLDLPTLHILGTLQKKNLFLVRPYSVNINETCWN